MRNNSKNDLGENTYPISGVLKRILLQATLIGGAIGLLAYVATAQISVPCSPNNPVVVTGDAADVTCFGYDNGAVDLHVSGGFPPYHYSWSNGATTQDVDGLAPGIYTVDVYDNWQCHGTAWFIIGQPTELELEIALTEQVCGQPSGCAIMSGGTPPYQLHVFRDPDILPVPQPTPDVLVDQNGDVSVTDLTSATDVVFLPIPNDPNMRCVENIPDGLYLVILTDANGCFDYQWITIDGHTITIDADITEPLCFGQSNGSIDVEIGGGTAPYSCYWAIPLLENSTDLNGDLLPVDPINIDNCSLENITAGIYFLFVEDANGCTATQTFHVGQNDPVNVDVELFYPDCGGQPDGCAYFSGGTGEYHIYLFEGPLAVPIDPVIDIAQNGDVSVTDLSLSTDVILPQPVPWFTDSVICVDDLPDGHFLIVIVDSNGCFDYEWFHVEGTPGLTVTGTITEPLCFGQSNGSIDVEIEGGTAPYLCAWAVPALNDPNSEPQELDPALVDNCDLNNITAGYYFLFVEDANGCTVTHTFHVGQNDPVDLEFELTYPDCGGQPDGCAYFSGGTGEYQLYSFTGPIVLPAPNELDILIDQSGNVTVTDLSANVDLAPNTDILPPVPPFFTDSVICVEDLPNGHWLFVLIDSNGCYDYEWLHVQGTPGLTVGGTITEPLCHGDANGSIEVEIEGGTAPYSCYWAIPLLENSTDPTGDLLPVDPTNIDNCSLENVSAGIYFLFVEDANGCTATHTFHVGQNDPVNVDVELFYSDCGGQPDGCAYFSGGTGEYHIYLFEGPLTVPTDPIIDIAQNGDVSVTDLSLSTDVVLTDPIPWYTDSVICVEDLPDGHFLIVIIDSNGCYDYEWFHVEGTPELTVTGTVTEPLCFGDSNGSIHIEIEGGTPPYTCAWAIPSLDPNGPNQEIDPVLVNNCSLNNIPAGTYLLFVEDANGCTITRTVHVGQPSELQLEIVLEYPLCGGQPSGCVFMNGGTAPYNLYVFTNLIIDPVPLPVPDVTIDGNGNVSVDAMSQTSVLDFIPDPNNDHVRCVNNIPDGLYLVLLIDANGCYTYEYIEIEGTAGLSINLDFDQYGAYACAFPDGGSAPYMISWSDLSGDLFFPAISQECVYELPEGIYTVTVTDANGCSETEIFIIDQLPCSAGFAEVIPDEIWSGMGTTFHLSNFAGDAIQWQFRTEFTQWLDVPNATTAVFNTPAIFVASDKEIEVRARITCADGDVLYSNVALLTVYAIESQEFVQMPDPELFGAQLTSISTPDEQIDLTVYPSPTTGQINLISDADQSNLEIIVTDLNGRTLTRAFHEQTIAGQRLEMDISGSTPGVYLVNFRSDRGARTERIILR